MIRRACLEGIIMDNARSNPAAQNAVMTMLARSIKFIVITP
jgi:hypothetical protein